MNLNLFAEANESFDEAEFVIYGVPYDRTSSFRMGSRWAPMTMRKVSYNFETYNQDLDVDLDDVPIHDMGDCDTYVNVDETLEVVYERASEIVKAGKIPIMMGGEHSLTYPCVKAYNEKIGFVVMDAHCDLRPEYGGVKHSHACVSRHVIEDLADKYVSIGIRSGPKEEWDYIRQNDSIKVFTANQVDSMGIDSILEEADSYLAGCDRIYLSLDMDAIDPAYAPGLGTPEPFGMTPRQVRTVIRHFAPRTVGFDVVEISPEYDSGDVTSVLGAKLIREFIAAKWKSMQQAKNI
ncbi:agmatinase [Methanocella sp. CWC-04]|uniref:Agmatinase n=1 Tax=Methanooceanicella nereidis TaxID=2052831 RepID=A0AAP2W6P0_9EURY|nr:agmatinase [Methanocella sp. CWC-04]MCD1295497.1 agmatinase [Methanocella sp. CWC-04]